ncbi:MAG: FCD domain-containing protein [Spirochaetaceae bacterium]|nr:FCD domain-containing protein [Spirochaetaceae bacterium]
MEEVAIPHIEAKSLKAQCAETLERLIISGELAVDALVPPERDLARRLGVSRPVVHEALVELASKGFVRVAPRRGVRVADFWRHGTLAIFESVVLHSEGLFAPEVLADMIRFRALIELEAARLAAASGGGTALGRLEALLSEEAAAGEGLEREADIRARSELDLRFHLLLAEASGSRILPLVLNSTIPVFRVFISRFYAAGPDLALVRRFHCAIVAAISERDVDGAVAAAKAMLDHGAAALGIPT